MANKTQWAPANTIIPVGGERAYSRLKNGAKSYAALLTARADVNVAVAPAGALRNRGSVWALFDEVGIEEDGRDRHRYDGRMLRYISEMFAPSPLTAIRADTPVALYHLEESAVIWFSHPLTAAPQETAYRELDARRLLQVFARMVAAPGAVLNARLFTVGGATVTISNVSISVTQLYDDRSPDLPVFIPTVRQITEPITGANPEQQIWIKTPQFIRGIVIQQDADEGERADILTSFALRGDYRDIIGPRQQNLDDLQHYSEFEQGGLVLSNQAYVGLNFQRAGKLSNVINPADDVNLRIEANVAPGAGTNPLLRIALLELERTTGLVSETIPFPI
jgi:hypothetical protein